MLPAWKVRWGHLLFGSSVRVSVRPSICPSVRNSVLHTYKVQYLKFVGHTVTQLVMEVQFGVGWVKIGDLKFCHILTLLTPGPSVFHKHMSSWFLPFETSIMVMFFVYMSVSYMNWRRCQFHSLRFEQASLGCLYFTVERRDSLSFHLLERQS